jgi:copper chaperone
MHCVKAIKSALQPIAGVTGVDVDLGGKLVTVTYDAAVVTIAALKAALASAGYPVSG